MQCTLLLQKATICTEILYKQIVNSSSYIHLKVKLNVLVVEFSPYNRTMDCYSYLFKYSTNS